MKPYCSVLITFAFLFLATSSHSGRLYRWQDESYVVHFTNDVHTIPREFRDKATGITPREIPVYPKGASIPLKPESQLIVIEAVVNDRLQGDFIVDTGSNYTAISWATAEELEINLDENQPRISIQTANGVVEVPVVALDSVEVSGMRVDDLWATVYDFTQDKSISGLLGLNFLSFFRMEVDPENGTLFLDEK
ncbi:MAG: aspartyl protease family protein [Candidatus Binatia bacterium]